MLNQTAHLYSSDWQNLGTGVGKETLHAHSRIAEAIIAGDPGLARLRMRKHLEAEAQFLKKRRSTRRLLPDQVVLTPSDKRKGAETVVRNITLSIVSKNMESGDLVGTEAELIEQEGVSRALFREAVRLLEHHQIARMRRGPGGGLFVVDAERQRGNRCGRHLSRPPRDCGSVELTELRTGVEVAIADLGGRPDRRRRRDAIDEALARELNGDRG